MRRRHALLGVAGLLLLGNTRAQGVSRVTVGPCTAARASATPLNHSDADLERLERLLRG